MRKKNCFDQKPGPTRYAARQIEDTKLSAFFMIFDLIIVNSILNNTNKKAQQHEPDLKFTQEDILAFIGILFCRGLFCLNTSVVQILIFPLFYIENFGHLSVKLNPLSHTLQSFKLF